MRKSATVPSPTARTENASVNIDTATVPFWTAARRRAFSCLAGPSGLLDRILQREDVNFVVTNRIPRRWLTLLAAWFTTIERPWIRDFSIRIWQHFAGSLNLHEARKSEFSSLGDCFIRELKPGVRPIDPRQEVAVSPCDGIVGACGPISGTEVIQAKGFPYTLEELLGEDHRLVEAVRDGRYATLRLTSAMYHRFHAPHNCSVNGLTYIPGDTWNVNPIAVKRVSRLYCKNERAVVPLSLEGSEASIVLVPVAAILVAGIHFSFVDVPLTLQYRGPNHIRCRASCRKGDELGYFSHGSTIVVLASPEFELCSNVREGMTIRMGEPLLQHR